LLGAAAPSPSPSLLVAMDPDTDRSTWKIVLAFAIIYLVWGSTFLAIRVGVHDVPPFLLAALRFLAAGILLYGWMRARGEPVPSGREWRSAFVLAIFIFVVDYGFVFWAERRVPSGVTAVMMATIPVFMVLSEIVVLGTQRLTLRLALALLIGLGGVAVLVSRALDLSGAPIDPLGAVALLFAAMGWAVGSALTRKLPLPASKFMSSGVQMLSGGVLLLLTAAALGEFQRFHPAAVSRGAWIALVYLIVAGSLVAYSAYVWLIHRVSLTKVGTYAYVNPVVAVMLGYFFAGEEVGARTIVGTLCVLVSVVMITTAPRATPAPKAPARERAKVALEA